MNTRFPVFARRELILGGQKSGKSRRAEQLAAEWLAADAAHRAVLVATGQAYDAEMSLRIMRHQRERSERAPGLRTVEEPLAVGRAIATHSTAQTLVLVDCLTLWLTNRLMPAMPSDMAADPQGRFVSEFFAALHDASGPVVLVSNEIGLGVIPLGAEVRAFVDELGGLNRRVAALCDRVVLMAAGLPLILKEPRG